MTFITLLNAILNILTATGAVAVAIAVAWTGYKLIFFSDHSAREGIPLLVIGAVMIVGARTVATLLGF